ncbi:unnamed protein product [Rotaria socialis]|uniref:Uncharacterized protein n=2 Tax=Rotaria socialis TaxID=392032 RepID=A0A817Z0P6_9BILA|nr:unnamed protein product [Rotaria socialis]CAF4796818.1 unnamed protein product [Rotaria socialis]
MKSSNDTLPSSNLIRETIIFLDERRDCSSSSNPQQSQEARKTSTIALREDEKLKNGSSKSRLFLAPTPHKKSVDLQCSKTRNLKSNNDNLPSTFEELKTELKTNNDETTEDPTQSTIGTTKIDQNLLKSEACSLQNSQKTEDTINETVIEQLNLSKDTGQKLVSLEEKLAENQELNIIGIMNLSSMNLTDDDIPSILQRAFVEQKKKCIGLILRDNGLTSVGVRMLVDALLATRTKLAYLSFSNNAAIGDRGIEHLARLLQTNRSITFLASPNTGMTDRSVRLLADILCNVDPKSSCSPLEKLHISFNKSITDESLEALTQILEQNQTLKVLSVQHCGLSDKGRRRLRHASAKKKKKKFSLSE